MNCPFCGTDGYETAERHSKCGTSFVRGRGLVVSDLCYSIAVIKDQNKGLLDQIAERDKRIFDLEYAIDESLLAYDSDARLILRKARGEN